MGFITGCGLLIQDENYTVAASPGDIYTTTQALLGTKFPPPEQDHFGAGQTPVAVVVGMGGKTIAIKVYDLKTGKMLETDSTYISKGNKGYYWEMANIYDGSFSVKLIGWMVFWLKVLTFQSKDMGSQNSKIS